MADNPSSSSQSTAKSNLTSASRVFILTPEMLKKLGLAEKVKSIQNRIKPENKVQLIKEVKKSDAPIKKEKLIEKTPKKSSNKRNIDEKKTSEGKSLITKPQENEQLINSNKLDKELKLEPQIISEELDLVSEEVQNESHSKSPVKTFENQKQKSPKKEPVEISENSEDLLKDSCDSPEMKSTGKIRSKFKPKVQWRSRKLPKDEKKEALDSLKSDENEEKLVTVNEELSTKFIKNEENENILLNEESEGRNEKTVALSPEFADKSEENLGKKEAPDNLQTQNVENDEEKSLNTSEVQTLSFSSEIASENGESEEIIEEILEFIEEEEHLDRTEEQVSESLENIGIEAADEVLATETLKNDKNTETSDKFNKKKSNFLEALNNELKSAVESFDMNEGVHEEGILGEVEEKNSPSPELPSNDPLNAEDSHQNDFACEAFQDDDSNGFEDIHCPSLRSSSDDEANPDFGPEILESEDNRLHEVKEPEEIPTSITVKIEANDESSVKKPKIPEEIEDNRLDAIDEGQLCFLPEESSPDAMIEGINIENTSVKSENTELLIETSKYLEKIEDNSLTERPKPKMNVSPHLFSESPQIGEETEDFNQEEREAAEELEDSREQLLSDNLVNANGHSIGTTEESEPILPEQKTESEYLKTDEQNLVPSPKNTPVPSPINEIPVLPDEERPLETLESQKKTARMNLLGLSERVSVDSSVPRPSESLETPEIQSNDQVPLTPGMKRKRRNTLAIETVETKPAKITRRGRRRSVNPAAEPETIVTPVRSSRRRSKPKIFEDCVSPVSSRRSSAASRKKREVVNNDDDIVENPSLPFDNFSAISEDIESPKKIINESKFGSDEESGFSDFRQSVNEEKIEEVVESKESGDEPKIEENPKLVSLENSNNEKEIRPETQESQKNPKKIKSRRRRGSRHSKRKSTKVTNKSSSKIEEVIEFPEIREDSSQISGEIPEISESPKNPEPESTSEERISNNITAESPKTPEIPQLTANNEEKLEENPVETPPELSPQCPITNRASDLRIATVPEISESIASPSTTPRTKKGRGRPKKQPLITQFLRPSPPQKEDPPPAEAEVPLRTRGRRRRIPEEVDEAKVPDVEEQNEETSRTRSRRTTMKPDETDGQGLSESDDESKIINEDPTSRRGSRAKGKRNASTGDRDYVPRVTKPSEVPVKPKEAAFVKCGKCQEEMAFSAWAKHSLAKHNNMSWREDEEKPDFDDEKRLKTLLTRTKKKKATLVCETCGEGKRSVAGFMSHIKFCGKTDLERQSLMWTCPLCTAILMPSSKEYHERQHREDQLPKVRNYANEDRQKRKAAERAVTEISRFTALVQEGDEPPSKKRRTKTTVQDFIQQPQMFKTIPGVWKGAWARSISNNEKAHCRQPGCTFSTNNLEEICEHHSTCNFTPRIAFICKICKTFNSSQSEIEKHVREEHADKLKDEDSDFEAHDSDASDYDNHDGTKSRRVSFKPRNVSHPQAKFLTDTVAYKKLVGNLTFIPSLKWTFDFEFQHFSFHLFDDLKPNTFTKSKEPEIYLPQMKTSMSFSHEKLKKGEVIEWKRWKRFESHIISDIPTFYTGGPIWALAWLPLPAALFDQQLDQYIAVSTHRTIGTSYEVGKAHKFRNSIQIWRIGNLSYESTVLEDPQLSYVVAHEYGTIWCMEWCPSGAYDHEDLHAMNPKDKGMKRMGLLAAASSSGLVLIYSLPFPPELPIPNDNYKSKVFKTEPIMILQVNGALQDDVNWQCMKLSWSKTSGHDTLVAGFSNGYVAVWDLTTKSPILRTQIKETHYLDAYQHFYAHNHAVMFVDIVPVKEKRYLATASMDRSSKTWDLEDTSAPVSQMKKGIAVDGVWMTHWPTSLTCYDDALTLQHTQTYANDVRGSQIRILPILPTNSTTYAIAKSDWSNGICHGTLAGEVLATFAPQLLYLRDVDKWSKDRWLVTNVELVDFEEEKSKEKEDYHYLPETYDECQKRFGVIYHDDLDNLKCAAWRKKNRRKGFLNAEAMEHVPVERYPFTSVNRISWNTNAWSYLWLAIGYENGLVRILNLNRMSARSIINDMLSKHAKAMFKKAEESEIS